MPDVVEAVAVLRYFVTSANAQPDAAVRLAAEAYRDGLAAALARMRQCVQYLDRERVAEAVHFASQEPDLLQACAALSFPELDEWAVQAELNGLPAPVGRIAAGDVQRLNQAYLREEGVRDLLVRHRRLALAKAPAAVRIDVLRRLRQGDPMVYGWSDDVRQLESVRQKELHEQVAAALERSDIGEIEALLEELRPEPWEVKPPDNWSAALRQALDDARNSRAQAVALREAAFMARSYYLRFGNRVTGPYLADSLRQRAASGWITDKHEISENRVDWFPAFQVEGLFVAASGTAPGRSEGAPRESPRWYYSRDGQVNGPYARDDLISLAASRFIMPDDPVWEEGAAVAFPAASVAMLSRCYSDDAPMPEPRI